MAGLRLVVAKGLAPDVHVDLELARSAARLAARQAIVQLLPDDADQARRSLDDAIRGLERLSGVTAGLAVQALREVRAGL